MSEIGCSLDIRAKGDGRDADRKWFTGAILQRFVEGGSDESVGGLKQNIQKIVDIIFRTTTTAPDPDPDPDPAPTPAPAPAKPKKAPRAGSKKRVGGFSAVEEAEAEMAPATGIPATTSSTPPPPPPPPDDEETASLRARYGSDMDLVKLIFAAWKQFGLLYANWKEEWPTVVDETVKEARALSVLRCAIAFSEAMTNVSYKKHKSWYVFLTVWVVPRQVAIRGDLFAYSTAPIEQRGARMKKIVRNCVSWRGPVFVSDSEDESKPKRRPYESCAMLQLLRSVVAQEQIWQSPHLAGGGMSVSQRRLLATGRTTIIKKEPMKLSRMAEEIIDLT